MAMHWYFLESTVIRINIISLGYIESILNIQTEAIFFFTIENYPVHLIKFLTMGFISASLDF